MFMPRVPTAPPPLGCPWQVREDIMTNLHLRPRALSWVMGFERTNLHFGVRRKQGGRDPVSILRNFPDLLAAGLPAAPLRGVLSLSWFHLL